MPNYYEVLGVEENASIDEIKQKYKSLAKQFHPDVCDDHDAEEKIKAINEAYEHIGDENKRAQYDAQRSGGFGGFGGFGDPFNNPFGGFTDMFNFQQPRMRQNSDIRMAVSIDYEQSLVEHKTVINYNRKVMCSDCNGEGAFDPQTCNVCKGAGVFVQEQNHGFTTVKQVTACPQCQGKKVVYNRTCSTCQGFGSIAESVEKELTLPLGSVGKTFIINGLGNQENRSLPPGKLAIDIHLNDHSRFRVERSIDECITPLIIDPVEAMLGGEFIIKSIEGENLIVNIPKGCKERYREEFKSKGIPLNETQRGSLYAEVIFDMDKTLTEEQTVILKQYLETKK